MNSDSRMAARNSRATTVEAVQAATNTPLASLRGALERLGERSGHQA